MNILLTITTLFIAVMLYLEYEYTIAVFVDKLKTNKQIEKWLIMLCDGVISASQSLMGFLFLASGIFIAGKLGIPIKLGDADIAMADEILLVFLFGYAIILSTVFWLVKAKIQNKISTN